MTQKVATTVHALSDDLWDLGRRVETCTPLYVDRFLGPRMNRTSRSHDYWELTAMLKGTLRLNGRNPLDLRPPMVSLVPPGYAHTEFAPDDAETVWVGFRATDMPKSSRCAPHVVESVSLTALIEQLWLFTTTTGGAIGPELDAQTSNIVYRFLRLLREGISDPGIDHLQCTIEFIANHFSGTMNMSEIAKRYGYSEGHFYRSFKARMGVSPNTYLTRLRLQHAKRLLRESSLPIKSIAEHIGIPDEAYFSRCFKKTCGFSPSAFRHSNP